jgi:MFS family permease
MLVNVGYAALVSFGASAIAANGARAAGLVIPVFAAVVILARGLAGSVPDRFGAERTLLVCCPLTAAGLCGVALATSTALVLVSLVVLAAGQAFAVPALGAIAVRRSPSAQHGATAGLFFAWFDAGVGLGGPVSGLAARLSDASGALLSASFAVALAPLVAGAFAAATLTRPRSRRGAPQRRTSRSSGHSRPQRG